MEEQQQQQHEQESLPLVAPAAASPGLQDDKSSVVVKPQQQQLQLQQRRKILTALAVVATVVVLGIVSVTTLLQLGGASSSAKDASNGSRKWNSTSSSSRGSARDRTGFHFQPPGKWMNDPNGPVYYRGRYHLFYQYNPRAAVWNQKISWGHAVSEDLVHWTHLPVALEPGGSWYDSNGVWSGSITIAGDGDGGEPTILYTGLSNGSLQTQNAAVAEDPSDPMLRRWRKLPQNPVISAAPAGVGGTDFRDPTTAWRNPSDGQWRVLLGAKKGTSGVGFLYKSSDFVSWELIEHPLFSGLGTGMWECPDFFPIGSHQIDPSSSHSASLVHASAGKYVFKASLSDSDFVGADGAYDAYALGSYDPASDRFIPEDDEDRAGLGFRYDHGNRFYASKSFFDPQKGRRVLWGWVAEADSEAEDVAKGWASIQSIPRSIWLGDDGNLMQLPVEEVKSLRIGQGIDKRNISLESGAVLGVEGGEGAQIDVEVVFQLPDVSMQMGMENFDIVKKNSSAGNAMEHCRQKGASVNGILGPFGLLVLATEDRREQTALFFHLGRSRNGLVALVCVDQSRSSSAAAAAATNSTLWGNSLLYGAYVEIADASIAGKGAEDELSMRVLVDRSVVEAFAQGGRISITSRVYPALAKGDSARLFLFNNGTGAVNVKRLSVWKMRALEFPQHQE